MVASSADLTGPTGELSDSGKLIAKLNGFDKRLDNHWGAWRPDARTAYDMVAGDQWDEAAKAVFEEEWRNPVVMNEIDPMISAISGAEINNRQEVKYSPRTQGAVQVNEVFTGAVKWSRDECDANDEESHAFRDALVCGMGVVETRMSYEIDPSGMTLIEQVDPLEVSVDPAAKKPNFVDKKYFRRDRLYERTEAEALFPALFDNGSAEGGQGIMGQLLSNKPHENYPHSAYDEAKGSQESLPEGMVRVSLYQWRELEKIYLVIDPLSGQQMSISKEQMDKLEDAGVMLQGVSMNRPKWRQAFRCGDKVMQEELPDGQFTYHFITGKFDRNKRHVYGIVKAMIDPQRWTNKFLSQADRIIAVNAKGGLLAEEDAFDDPRKAEEDWARADSIIWTKTGKLGAVIAKPAATFPSAMDRLFQISDGMLNKVTGISAEMLGQADREQAGVLEHQRKQAAFGVLAIFFDSLRRYRKLQGRLHLALIAKYMTDGRLVRITNDQGLGQYVPLTHDPNVQKFDVIVDDAPNGPNQQEKVWAMLQGLPAVMKAMQGLPPEIALAFLEYSPFPSSLVSKIKEVVQAQMQSQQQGADPMKQLAMAKLTAEIRSINALAMSNEAKAGLSDADAAEREALMAVHRANAAALVQELVHNEADRKAAMAALSIPIQPGGGILPGADEPPAPSPLGKPDMGGGNVVPIGARRQGYDASFGAR